ncbi:MAG TPA: glycosyltransferase family 39 protein [Conexibacter sp.]|jgi:4-amino-4-deoxy-L-arabinose transferase-like glycosyltransferase|nr:glycosyltransferase family 39 protein [Conexibacter sp.]
MTTPELLAPGSGLPAPPRPALLQRNDRPRISGWAWGAATATAAFILVSCWWLSRDQGLPYADNASHLVTVVAYRDLLLAGDPSGDFWTRSGFYPPMTFLVGAMGMLVGGLHAWTPVLAENLVYVPLLAAGCFGAGRLLAGPRAGLLAVVFALGSPLVAEQFHVFMIDAPLAALVAAAVWLTLASERFAKPVPAAFAGAVVGIGLSSKTQFPLFVVGLLLVAVARGGWRNGRGLLAFAVPALVLGMPWYAANLDRVDWLLEAAGGTRDVPPDGRPALLSAANATWYLWATLNALLFAPLFLFAAVGVGGTALALVRTVARRTRLAVDDVRPELLGGLLLAWLALTVTPHHDLRYTMPLIVYLATLGTAWIVRLGRRPRRVVTAGLALAVVATTLGSTFGVGSDVRVDLGDRPLPAAMRAYLLNYGVPPQRQVVLYAPHDFMVSAPRRETDIPGVLAALRAQGYTGVGWIREQAILRDPAFDLAGLWLLVRFAGLEPPSLELREPWDTSDPGHVLLLRQPLPAESPACAILPGGDGMWAMADGGEQPICPTG